MALTAGDPLGGGLGGGAVNDAECINSFASLARQDQARVGRLELIRLMHLAGYGDTPECRSLMAGSDERVVMVGEHLRLYVVRARERMPGARARWGDPNLRPANDWPRRRS